MNFESNLARKEAKKDENEKDKENERTAKEI